jgi:hypothetical protein
LAEDGIPGFSGAFMSSPRILDAVKWVFTETITARDIAEPLASFDANGWAIQSQQHVEN